MTDPNEHREELKREPVPAELEGMLPPVPGISTDGEAYQSNPIDPATAAVNAEYMVPNSEPEHPEVEPEVLRPCKACGVSLEGEHPRRQTCKPCQQKQQSARTEAHTEKLAELPPDAPALSFEMPVLVIVEGENPDITGWVVSIYKLLKHHFGLSKNGITEVLGSFRGGNPKGEVVDLYLEMLRMLGPLEFADAGTKMGLVCGALEKCLGKDINMKMRAF